MAFRNFAGNDKLEAQIRAGLLDEEDFRLLVDVETSYYCVTSARTMIYAKAGGFAVIRNSHISTFEIKPSDGAWFLTVHFGPGLSRTVKVPNYEQADAIVTASLF